MYAATAWVKEAVGSEARAIHVHELPGATTSTVDALDVDRVHGTVEHLVLRRYTDPAVLESEPDAVNREVAVLGARLPREAWRVRGRIGYVGHEPLLYRDLTVGENLRFHARLYRLEAPDRRIAELLDRVGMARREDEVVGNL